MLRGSELKFFIKLFRGTIALYYFITLLLDFFVGLSYHRKSLFAHAVECYKKAISKNKTILKLLPNHIGFPAVHIQLGKIYIQQNKIDLAIEEFHQAITIDDKDSYPHMCLGVAYDKQGNLNRAIEEYKKAIIIEPDDPYIRNNLGLAYYNQGNLKLAVQEYKKALCNPEYDTPAFAHNNLGLTYFQQGDYALALEEYEQAIDFAPDNPSIYCNIAEVHRVLENKNQAIGFYKKSLELDPTDLPSLLGLGKLYKDVYEDYISVFRKECEYIISLAPDNPKIPLNIGITYLEAGNIEEAINYITQAIKINPHSALAHNSLGIAFAELEDFENAISCCQHALTLDPEMIQTHFALGNIYEETGDFDRAVECYENYINSKNPVHEEIYERLIDLYTEKGKLEEAQIVSEKLDLLEKQCELESEEDSISPTEPFVQDNKFEDIDINKHIELIEAELRNKCF